MTDSLLQKSLPERRPWLWEGLEADLKATNSEVSLPLCAGFRAPVERLAEQAVAEAVSRAVAAIDDMRSGTWATVVTEPCGLEKEDGLPPGMGLPGRVAQISKQVVDDAVSNALKALQFKREKKWRIMSTECSCSSKLDSGLPPSKGLPRRAAQLASDVVAAAIGQVMAVSLAHTAASAATTVPMTADTSEECCICLGPPERPVELPCGHHFCADCLLRLVSEDRSYQNRSCPLCRGQLYSVPEDYGPGDTESEYGYEMRDVYRYASWFGAFFLYCSLQREVLYRSNDQVYADTPRSEHEVGFE